MTIPPIFGVYKLLSCQEATCPDPMTFGISGLARITTVLCMRAFDDCHHMQKEKAECSVNEFANLIGQLPEVVDSLSLINKNQFVACSEKKITTCKLSFSITELEKMFGGYDTYYGIDTNGKPSGRIEIDNERISHPLITTGAINQHY